MVAPRRSAGPSASLACIALLLAPASRVVALTPDAALWPVLATHACGAGTPPGAAQVGIDGAGVAQVLCPSAERVANHAIRQRSECRRVESQWHCEPLGKEFVLDVNGRSASVLYPAALNSYAAWQMARAITPMTIPLAQDARTRRPERCQLTGDYSDLKIARMALRCLDWTVDFVRLCDDSGCRHEPAGRLSNARPNRSAPRR
jgi:hypothetical protein